MSVEEQTAGEAEHSELKGTDPQIHLKDTYFSKSIYNQYNQHSLRYWCRHYHCLSYSTNYVSRNGLYQIFKGRDEKCLYLK